MVITLGFSGTILVWSISERSYTTLGTQGENRATSLGMSLDGRFLFASIDNSRVRCYDLTNGMVVLWQQRIRQYSAIALTPVFYEGRLFVPFWYLGIVVLDALSGVEQYVLSEHKCVKELAIVHLRKIGLL